MESNKQNNMIMFAIGAIMLLIFVLGATYAYFSIGIQDDTTQTDVTGEANDYGTATLTTTTKNLYFKFVSDEMGEDNKGITYYANNQTVGTPLTTNPNYVLATASLIDGIFALDCTYNFKLTASVTNAISDNSDDDVKITIGDTTKTLKEITAAGANGVIVSGTITKLETGADKTIPISGVVVNSETAQDDLSNNSFTITIAPYTNGSTKSFACSKSKTA